MSEITARADARAGYALHVQRANEVAGALQHGLLFDPVKVDWLDLAIRYRPAIPGLQVGGDWYDTLSLPDGGVGLVVGDVVGHDPHAASTMIQLRSMLEALAHQPGAEPATVLTALNRLSTRLGTGTLATLVYGRLEQSGQPAEVNLTWANAGHPPPVLVSADRTATVLEHTHSPLLSPIEHHYRQTTLPIPSRSLLLLYTDGLIEHPDHPGADPIAELAATASRYATGDLHALCDELISHASGADDITLLALRVRS